MRFLLRMAVWALALVMGALRPVLFGFHRWMIQEPRERAAFVLRKMKSVKGAGVALRRGPGVFASGGHGLLGSMALGFGAAVLILTLTAAMISAVALTVHGVPELHASSADAKHVSPLLAAVPIVEKRQALATVIKEANAALEIVTAKAKAEGRALSAEELKAQDDWDQKISAAKQAVDLEEKKLERERMAAGSRSTPEPDDRTPRLEHMHHRADDDRSRGFTSHRDFLLAALDDSGATSRDTVRDERLKALAVVDEGEEGREGRRGSRVAAREPGMAFVLPEAYTPRSVLAAAGSDEQGAYADQYGGALVGRSMLPLMLQVGFEGDPTAGRTQPIPMETPIVDIPARTDKNHTTSVVGGFTVTRKPETVLGDASRAKTELVSLKAHGLFGFGFATEDLLAMSALSFVAIVDSGFRTQFPAALLNEKIRGAGGMEFLGVKNSPAKVSVSKDDGQAARTISGMNVINMAARQWNFSNSLWLANHDCRPQLATASITVGTSGVLLYQPSKQEGFPDMLWGRPIYYTEFADTVGTEGDLMNVDWSQYLEGVHTPLQSAESVHVRFLNHERAFKFWIRNAGAPWWRSALTPNKSTDTLSPIVMLATRA